MDVEFFIGDIRGTPFADQVADPYKHADRPDIPGVIRGEPGRCIPTVRTAAQSHPFRVGNPFAG